jgi:mono/diheme cytochrome c family protein
MAGLVPAIHVFTTVRERKRGCPGRPGMAIEEMPMRKLLAVALLVVTSPAAAQDAAAIGEEVYEQHCQSCHGEKLRSAGAIPDLRDLGENERAKFDTMVMEGRGQMPAWQGIVSPQELDQLWAYIRSRAR